MVINDIAGREERKILHITVNTKLERLRLARLTRHDQAVRLLDMQKLQEVKAHKHISTSFNPF
jgi:hypothetical protein